MSEYTDYIKANNLFNYIVAYFKNKNVLSLSKDQCVQVIEHLKENPEFQSYLSDFKENQSQRILDIVFKILSDMQYLETTDEKNYTIIMNDRIKEKVLNHYSKQYEPITKSFVNAYFHPMEKEEVKEKLNQAISQLTIQKQENEVQFTTSLHFLLALCDELMHQNPENTLDQDMFSKTVDELYHGKYNIRLDSSLVAFLGTYFERPFKPDTDQDMTRIFNDLTTRGILERDPSGSFRFKIHIPEELEPQLFQNLSAKDTKKLTGFATKYLEIKQEFQNKL